MSKDFVKNNISFVLPCLNEETGIKDCILRIQEVIDKSGMSAEIIVVDNGSIDKSADIAQKMGAKVFFEPKKGYGNAYKKGFDKATGDFIIALDADGTYSPKDAEKMFLLLLEKDLDFVSGNRLKNINKKSMPAKIVFGNYLFSLVFNILFFTWISDTQSGVWVFKRKILDDIKLKDGGMGFSSEIKLKVCKKYKFFEYPVSYSPRYGDKKLNVFKHGLQVLRYFLKQRIEGY